MAYISETKPEQTLSISFQSSIFETDFHFNFPAQKSYDHYINDAPSLHLPISFPLHQKTFLITIAMQLMFT